MISKPRAMSLGVLLLLLPAFASGQDDLAQLIRESYDKREAMVSMRDGVELFTSIYVPKDRSRKYPFLIKRTPYGVGPYGAGEIARNLGPSPLTVREGYIFVNQDVRGRGLSLGQFVNMRPHREVKKDPREIDESSDTFDTIEWLLKNVEPHNGAAGMYGISYPGFYAAAGMIDAHPALKAVSPQAPIADWFFDDFHHHGAFFLPHAFNLLVNFGVPRTVPGKERPPRFEHGTKDGYEYFLNLGPLPNATAIMRERKVDFWEDLIRHPDYDSFWQERNLLPHLKSVAPAVMTVGGWFDAEDLYGPLKIYREVEKNNPGVVNFLVMGPWPHGGWSRGEGERLGKVPFESKTSLYYQENIEAPFFRRYLKGESDVEFSEAHVFDTGKRCWRAFSQWPPKDCEPRVLYLKEDFRLSWDEAAPQEGGASFDAFLSDPSKPVPFTQEISIGMTSEYMIEDQRFASRRPDVLVYRTGPLAEELTLAGPITADLWVATSASDCDVVVKLIDVLPEGASAAADLLESEKDIAGAHLMVRSEVIRGRFRNGYKKPEPFTPGEPARVRIELQDVLHTFRKGHEVMIHVQSTWFPLVDRNPQKFVQNIFEAKDEDFTVAEHRVYRQGEHCSAVRVGCLPPRNEGGP